LGAVAAGRRLAGWWAGRVYSARLKTSERPELKEPVRAFAARIADRAERIPLCDLAALFGADEALLARVRSRGDLLFRGDAFSNDGPELVVEAGKAEIEIPSLIRGTCSRGPGSFALTFPMAEFSLRACVRIAVLRKCFDLKDLRASPRDLVLDFGNSLADRRYTF